MDLSRIELQRVSRDAVNVDCDGTRVPHDFRGYSLGGQ